LIELLGSDRPETRVKAARTLVLIGPDAADAVPALVRLVEQGGADPHRSESGRRQGDWSAQAALEAIGSAAVPGVEELLRHPDSSVRSDAARILGGIGPSAFTAADSLTTALDDHNVYVRRWVMLAVLEIGRVNAPLREKLRSVASTEAGPELRDLASRAASLPLGE
jgi:HEAT repeat protein